MSNRCLDEEHGSARAVLPRPRRAPKIHAAAVFPACANMFAEPGVGAHAQNAATAPSASGRRPEREAGWPNESIKTGATSAHNLRPPEGNRCFLGDTRPIEAAPSAAGAANVSAWPAPPRETQEPCRRKRVGLNEVTRARTRSGTAPANALINKAMLHSVRQPPPRSRRAWFR